MDMSISLVAKLRAIWYIFEIAVKENTDIRGGMVQISWVKNASLFDYDLKVRLWGVVVVVLCQ